MSAKRGQDYSRVNYKEALESHEGAYSSHFCDVHSTSMKHFWGCLVKLGIAMTIAARVISSFPSLFSAQSQWICVKPHNRPWQRAAMLGHACSVGLWRAGWVVSHTHSWHSINPTTTATAPPLFSDSLLIPPPPPFSPPVFFECAYGAEWIHFNWHVPVAQWPGYEQHAAHEGPTWFGF